MKQLMNPKHFNRGLADGEGFCNRVIETKQLLKNIQNVTHSLLVSPRRYGKTSLALHAIQESGLPYVHLDLFLKYDDEAVLKEFYEGMGSLLSQVMKPTEKALRALEAAVKNAKISLRLGPLGFEFSLLPVMQQDQGSLKSLLLGVEEVLAKQKQHAVIFIDEIQTIVGLPVCDEIEAALRFVAQKTKHISFIFSGSNRHLLGKLFDDRSRPFYKLCQQMMLMRIEKSDYIPFIMRFAKKQWKQAIPMESLDRIFQLTQCHPYYVNILCERVFALPTVPDSAAVDTQWQFICREEQGSVVKDVELLTIKQKQLLKEIAKAKLLTSPTAKEFLQNVNLTPRGVTQALETLQKHDLIEKTESGALRVVDPVLLHWLT